MKKKKIFNLIILSIVLITVGFGIWKFNEKFKISFEENKLISCREHIDKDEDMFCDVCRLELPFSNYAEVKNIEASYSGENKLEIYGYMPKNSNAIIEKISDPNTIAKKYKKDILDEEIIAGFDISIDYKDKKYTPKDYSQKVDVTISNLDLDTNKTYALLHIKDDGTYEILQTKEVTKDSISFTTGSFSTYIIITVGTNTVTFDGENFKVLDTNGEEITNGATVASGTEFSFNIVPNNYYGVTDVSCSTADAMTSYGNIKGKACYIASVSENMTIAVTTALAPSITSQPQTQKVKQGSTAVFSVVASDATTYEWQYRENKTGLWKSVTSTLGNSYTSANFNFTQTLYGISYYEFRCLVGNANFTAHERVVSDIATVSVAQDDLVIGETPIIITQPNMEKGKGKVNSTGAAYSITAMGGSDLTFTWQYRENKNELWKNITSSIGSASTSTPSDSTTSKPLKKSTFTTVTTTYITPYYEFRCLVGNSFYKDHDAIKSDIVCLSKADDDIVISAQVVNLNITKHPESQKVKLGDKATFVVTATGAGTYKWQYLPSGEELWKDVTSTMSSTYNKASMVLDTSGMSEENSLSGARFRCVVSSSAVSKYTKTTDEAVLSIAQGNLEKDISFAKVISPKDVTVVEGNEAKFTAGLDPAVTGLKYEWHEVNGETDVNLATQLSGEDYIGADTGTLTIPAELVTLSKNGYKYYCDIGGIITDKATLTVKEYVKPSLDSDEITVSLPSETIVYDGNPHTVSFTVKHGDKVLTENTDYTVVYLNNINAGKATILLSGIGAYQGTREVYFMINQRPITVKPKDVTKVYDGSELKPSDEYEITSGTLVSGHSIEVTNAGSRTDVGTGTSTISTLTIKDENNKDVTSNYAVTKATGSLIVTANGSVTFEITLEYDSIVYDGTSKTPSANVKAFGKILSAGTDYKLEYSNNVDAGIATVTITGLGNYDGSLETKEFTITKRKIVINASSATKEYDGKELTSSKFEISDGSLAKNHTLTASMSGSITNVGSVSNTVSTYKIFFNSDDVTKNYEVTTKEGKLTVTPASMTGSGMIKGKAQISRDLTFEFSTVPEDYDSVEYSWYYGTENDINTASLIDGENSNKLKLSSSMKGKLIFAKARIKKANYNDLVIFDVTDSDNNGSQFVEDRGPAILMAETETNAITNKYILGNSSITQRRGDVVSIIINDTETAPIGAITSWDVSKEKDEGVTAWLVPNGSKYSLYIGAEGKITVSDGYALFSEYTNCTSITGLNNLSTYEVTNMSRMFSNLTSITGLDVRGLDTASCSDFGYMFSGCSALTGLDVSGFDTIRATNMKMMFNGLNNAQVLNVSGFDTVNVKDMSGMFKGCSRVSTLDVSLFDTSNVENMASMFSGCSNLTSLDVTGFITTKVKSMGRMFKDLSKLTRLDLCSFDLAKLDGSTYLESVNGVKDTDVVEMFKGCTNLKSILLGKHFTKINGVGMFEGCTALNIIIAQSETPMDLSTNTGLNSLVNAIIYVPNDSSYTNYLKANNYSSVFGDRRIKRMLEVLGESKVNLYYGDTYTSAGALVAGCTEDSKDVYESYGYTLEVTGLPVDTTVIGIHKVKFVLKYMNTTIDSM